MDVTAIIIGASWTLAGLVNIALAIPLIRGKVARNTVYGMRLPRAMESDEAWFAINRYGGQRMVLWSLPMILTGLVAMWLPLQSNVGLALLLGFAPLVFVLVPVCESWRFARRYSAVR